MPHGLTAIKIGSKIVPVRNFGKATHVVVGLKELINDDSIDYVALDSREDLRHKVVVSGAEYITEVIFCNEEDWWRAKYDCIKGTNNFNL